MKQESLANAKVSAQQTWHIAIRTFIRHKGRQ